MQENQLENKPVKFGVMILYFNAERTILRCIDNCAPFVDRIYVSYSEKPWSSYNPDARATYKNNSDPNLIKTSRHYHKISWIEGEWDTEQAQRNDVVRAARNDGMDYLIIQDADEFYFPEAYEQNKKGIIQNPDHPYYYNPWINFWKNLDYIVLERKNILGTKMSPYSDNANFAINLNYKKELWFDFARRVNAPYENAFKLPGVCLHLSYVYNDDDVFMKIKTWGHSQQVQQQWYKYKWLAWKPGTRYINSMMGPVWHKAKKYEGPLPEELKDFPQIEQQYIALTPAEKFSEGLYNLNQLRMYVIHRLKALVAWHFKLGQFKKKA